MKTKLIALSLAAVLLFSLPVFADNTTDSFESLAQAYGITPSADSLINRAEFSLLTFQAFSIINGNVVPDMESKNPFSDVGEKNEDIYIVMLYGIGIVNGTGDGAFQPRRAITKQEACVMLARAKMIQDPNLSFGETDAMEALSAVKDADKIADWAKVGVGYLVSKGTITLTDGAFFPDAPMTFGEALTLCRNFVNA